MKGSTQSTGSRPADGEEVRQVAADKETTRIAFTDLISVACRRPVAVLYPISEFDTAKRKRRPGAGSPQLCSTGGRQVLAAYQQWRSSSTPEKLLLNSKFFVRCYISSVPMSTDRQGMTGACNRSEQAGSQCRSDPGTSPERRLKVLPARLPLACLNLTTARAGFSALQPPFVSCQVVRDGFDKLIDAVLDVVPHGFHRRIRFFARNGLH